MLSFDNRLVRELPGDPESRNYPRQVLGAAWSAVAPTPVAAPRLLAFSPEVAAALGLDEIRLASPEWVSALAGNRLLPGMMAYATCYGGHQFGTWAGQLGDGRAICLGETVNAAGERFELQLKGAGRTPYCRGADGRAVLRSSLREFLASEAMHHLGVPTTRALALVASGENVIRDMFYDGRARAEPGAIVCRVAPSFLRFGHFELPASRGDTALLRRLVDFVIDRDFPALRSPSEDRVARWFIEVCERTARLMVDWMRVGFVHGVMNTDNLSIIGLTIDYGPFGWVDDFDPAWTPNTTDFDGRRYCFGRQPQVALWNLERLAEALASIADPGELAAGLAHYRAVYQEAFAEAFAAKFGFKQWQDGDSELVDAVFGLMQAAEADMTCFFRDLAKVDPSAPEISALADAFYRPDLLEAHREAVQHWLCQWGARVVARGEPRASRIRRMNAANPRYVLRNYLAQQAIERAEQGEMDMIHELLEVLRRPYEKQPGRARFAAKRPDWAKHKPGCSMLSCSS